MKLSMKKLALLCMGMIPAGEGAAAKAPRVTLEMENGQKIVLELDYSKAPNTVKNFISLVKSGAYDGVIFHRVIPDFMIQGGDPTGTGTGGPGYCIKGEFSQNRFAANDLKHNRGTVSMARSQSPDSAGCQFFICVADSPWLDGQYAAFGHVVEGMETADAIVSVKRDGMDKPFEKQMIRKAAVDTFGADYGEPDVIRK